MNILNAEQMRAADAHTIQDLGIPSITLMENAAAAVTSVILQCYPQTRKPVIVCGMGNNGGDGLAVARLLKQKGMAPAILLLAKPAELKGDPAVNMTRVIDAQIPVIEVTSSTALRKYFADCDLVVDAIFGTGLTRPAEKASAIAIEAINASGKQVVSIDVPSGLSSDTGTVPGTAVRATVTVSIAALKHCHVFAPAALMCGDVYVSDIGIPTTSSIQLLRANVVATSLPVRAPDSHKGAFGHALVIAGSSGKAGAAYLCGKAALRAGAGLVTVASPANAQSRIAGFGPEIMTEAVPGNPDFFSEEAQLDLLRVSQEKSAAAIGPGIGTDKQTLALFQQLVAELLAPLVIDADGLNLLAMDLSILTNRKPATTVLTPHPGEMGRLLGIETRQVQEDRIGAAQKLSTETKTVVVLKGYRTIIATPGGSVQINPTGSQSLASGGTGDVLTGLITGLMAQGLSPENAACSGTFIHGLIGNLFENKYPQQALNAMDMFQYFNDAVHAIRTNRALESDYLRLHL